MNFYLSILFILFFALWTLGLSAQSEALRSGGKMRLDFTGIPIQKSEIRARLLQKGVQLDSLVIEKLAIYKPIIQEVLGELFNKHGQEWIKVEPVVIKDTVRNEAVVQYRHFSGHTVGYQAPTPAKAKTDTLFIKETPIDYSCNGIGIYGQHIFKDKTLELFQISNDIKAPDHYILGVGDEITVTIYGRSQADLKFSINSEGYIAPEGMPRIFLKGVAFREAKRLLSRRFAQAYNFLPEQFTARITSVRNITVNIFGDVLHNGSYVIPAVNTAFNAIVAAGGPTDIGGIRAIKLIQNGNEKLLDVYDFLLDPTIAFEYQLEENAVIYVPTAEKVITIKGAVKRPCTYELQSNETLIDLIDYAGGLTDDAATDRIQIFRTQNNTKSLVDVNLKELLQQNQSFDLFKGDTVMIYKIDRPLENFVKVSGEVKYPGKFALQKEMSVIDLIKKAQLLPTTKTDLAYLIRTNLDQRNSVIRINLQAMLANPDSSVLKLMPKDELLIFGQKEFVDRADVSIDGAVRKPGYFPFDSDQNLTIQDLIHLAEGLKPNAAQYGYVKRIDLINEEVVDYIKVDLKAAMADINAPENLILQPNDQLIIYTNERYAELHYLEIDGAVREPGRFDFDRDLRLSDLVYLAGGLQEFASKKGYILRSNLENSDLKTYIRFNLQDVQDPEKDLILKAMDYVFIQDNRNFTDTFPIKILGAVRNPGEYILGDSLEIRDIIELAGGLKYEAAKNHIDLYRLEFEGQENTRKFLCSFGLDSAFQIIDSTLTDTLILDSLKQFHLKPFDHIIIREIPGFGEQELVKIEGAVTFPGYYVLPKEDFKLGNLIEEAGGLTEQAFARGATLYRTFENAGFVVVRLDKAIRSPSSIANIILKEGDLIKIPRLDDVVHIRVPGTLAGELYPQKFLDNGMISVAYQGKLSAKWYIKNFAAGFSKSAKRSLVVVEYPNRHLLGTKNFLGYKTYPKVTKGSTIGLGLKRGWRFKLNNNEKKRGSVDWEKVMARSVTTLTSIFGLIVLVDQVTR